MEYDLEVDVKLSRGCQFANQIKTNLTDRYQSHNQNSLHNYAYELHDSPILLSDIGCNDSTYCCNNSEEDVHLYRRKYGKICNHSGKSIVTRW